MVVRMVPSDKFVGYFDRRTIRKNWGKCLRFVMIGTTPCAIISWKRIYGRVTEVEIIEKTTIHSYRGGNGLFVAPIPHTTQIATNIIKAVPIQGRDISKYRYIVYEAIDYC